VRRLYGRLGPRRGSSVALHEEKARMQAPPPASLERRDSLTQLASLLPESPIFGEQSFVLVEHRATLRRRP
jgi:hypothetical protein